MDSPDASFELHAQRVLAFLQERLPFAIWMVTRAAGKDQIVLQAEGSAFGMAPGDRLRWSDSFCSRMVTVRAPASRRGGEAGLRRDAVLTRAGRQRLRRRPDPRRGRRCSGRSARFDPAPQPSAIAGEQPLVELLGELLGAVMAAERALDAERRHTERAERSSRTDPLTGVGNRRLWDEVLKAEDARCARYGDPAGVIVLDLDGLKTRNDEQGHAAGDALIRRTAEVLSGAVRVHDFVARVGGDEFGVLAIRTDGEGLEVLRGRLAEKLEEAGIRASVGAAARSPEVSLDQAVAAADAEMYEAKRARARAETTAATI